MMKSAYWYMLAIAFACSQKILAQSLLVGDTIPDITLFKVWNHYADSLKLSDWKGKVIILDFWGFNCLSCLQSFSKLDSLQKEYKDRIQIVLVNTEGKNKTINFFEKRKKLTKPVVPFITHDTVLNTLFPHTGVPFHVWIDPSGKISYLTGGQYLTKSNLDQYLKGIDIRLPKAEMNTYTSSLFKAEAEPFVKYFSYLAKCMDGGSYQIEGLQNQQSSVNTTYCVSIKDLYQFAYNESMNEGYHKFREPGRTVLEVDNKFKYEYPDNPLVNESWMLEHGYYYHSVIPTYRKNDRFKIMQADLERYFNLEVEIEEREVNCLVLLRTSQKDKLKTKGGLSDQHLFVVDLRLSDTSSIGFIRNKPFTVLYNQLVTLGNYTLKMKIVDLTGYKGNIDFEMKKFETGSLTLADLRKTLKKYDLDLVERRLRMQVLILRETKEAMR